MKLSEPEAKCCDKQDIIEDTQPVLFKVDNAVHLSKKMMGITVKWCANCKRMAAFSYLEL